MVIIDINTEKQITLKEKDILDNYLNVSNEENKEVVQILFDKSLENKIPYVDRVYGELFRRLS